MGGRIRGLGATRADDTGLVIALSPHFRSALLAPLCPPHPPRYSALPLLPSHAMSILLYSEPILIQGCRTGLSFPPSCTHPSLTSLSQAMQILLEGQRSGANNDNGDWAPEPDAGEGGGGSTRQQGARAHRSEAALPPSGASAGATSARGGSRGSTPRQHPLPSGREDVMFQLQGLMRHQLPPPLPPPERGQSTTGQRRPFPCARQSQEQLQEQLRQSWQGGPLQPATFVIGRAGRAEAVVGEAPGPLLLPVQADRRHLRRGGVWRRM